ncbi:MAG: hypothetical protein ABF471_11790, partial [Acetobacter orientalis]
MLQKRTKEAEFVFPFCVFFVLKQRHHERFLLEGTARQWFPLKHSTAGLLPPFLAAPSCSVIML